MKTKNGQFVKHGGSALILVVVVTVLLAVVGVMFLMVARASELETGAVVQNKNLGSAVDTVVARIKEVLVEDLFGTDSKIVNANVTTPDADEPYDYPRNQPGWLPGPDGVLGTNDDISALDDPWLCTLEPVFVDIAGTPMDSSDDRCYWLHITDLWNRFDSLVPAIGNPLQVILNDGFGTPNLWVPKDPLATSPYDQADADGDGVADSRWVQVPGLTTSRGKPVFAAVRIIDNCAMLNLNVACNFFSGNVGEGIWHTDPWYYSQSDSQLNPAGRHLSEINYRFFLRGLDRNLANVKAIERAKDPTPLLLSPKAFHDALVMNIENPPFSSVPFDIADELEIRNRYLLTSLVPAKFENEAVAYETFDWGRGQFVGGWNTPLRVKRTLIETNDDFLMWQNRLNSVNSDNMSGSPVSGTGDYYDRRHLCTFYSFDRDLPKGDYPLLDSEIQAYAIANLASSGFSNPFEYKEHLWELWGPVFVPKGTVTTNIETPLAVDALGNSLPPYNNVQTRRKILHLLYALREYYYDGTNLNEATKKSAQIVANIIDFSDGNFNAAGDSDPSGSIGDHPWDFGPFYNDGSAGTMDYGSQANLDCTFITKDIIDKMVAEVSTDIVGSPVSVDYGLPSSDIVFGYERQPFISEIYAERDTSSGTPLEFAIELVNPYLDPIDLTGWKLRIGSSYETPDGEFDGKTIPKTDLINGPGRFVIYNKTESYTDTSYTHYWKVAGMPLTFTTGDCKIVLTRIAPANSGETEIVVDAVQGDDYNKDITDTIFQDGEWSSIRKDASWSFINPQYSIIEDAATIGSANDPNDSAKAFQLAVPDDGEPLTRWGDIEVLSLYGNPSFDLDPNNNDPITAQIDADPNGAYFDLLVEDADILDYISPLNRPDYGSLPGRININTAPLHVIAAALPPDLIRLKSDPNTVVTVAQMIIDERPYENISQLLDLDFFTRFADDDDNIFFSEGAGYRRGDDQNIKDDIQERDWFMTHLANKFTVRSDVFTAYILVRLGEEGPQRRMIAIFDRSQVWDKNDRPKLVTLHPVPDPR